MTRRWWNKGEQPLILSPGGKKGIHMIGAVAPLEGTVHVATTKRHTAKTFRKFLIGLMQKFKHKKKIYLILDNAPIHHANCLQGFLKQIKNRLELIFLPSYSPKLNPIEHFWKYMRKKVTHNTFYATFGKFDAAIRNFLTKHKIPTPEVFSLCKIS
jgi:transposase